MRKKIDVPFADDAEVERLAAEFAACKWPYERWTHRAHLALGAWLLRRMPFEEARATARTWIDRYNRTCGDPEGYHETITVLFLKGIAARMKAGKAPEGLAALVEELNETLTMKWPLEFFSKERLWSAEARREWVAPDLMQLDE